MMTALAASLGVIQVGLVSMLLVGGDGEPAPEPPAAAPGVPVLGEPAGGVAEAIELVEDVARVKGEAEAMEAAEEAREPERKLEVTQDAGFQSTLVGSFPFEDNRTTAASELRRVDTYSCAPTTNESGPEIWYAVDVPRPGRLRASILESKVDGIDVDVHILSGTSGDTCLSRGNAVAAAAVNAGRYWVAIDTYVVGGIEKSGGYELTISLD